MTTDQTDHRADPVQAVAEAHPNYATGSHEGVRCLGCNAPIAAPGGSYTMGWNLHLIEAAVAAARPAIEREAKAEAWDEGANTAWERSTPEVNGQRYWWRTHGEPTNPYRIEREVQA